MTTQRRIPGWIVLAFAALFVAAVALVIFLGKQR